MCGRFTLRTPMNEVARAFDLAPAALERSGGWRPRFNVAPSQAVATILQRTEGGTRQAAWLQWGLVPSWADEPTTGYRMINARAETVSSRRAFRDAFVRRRCLVPADGFFEWKRGAKPKQPYYIRLEEDRPFALAGLWERWHRGDLEIQSCTIITTVANPLVADLHDRMPVILDPHDYDVWLDPGNEDTKRLGSLLASYPAERMVTYPVSTSVNSPRHDDPSCIEKAAPGKVQGSLFD